MPEKILDKEKIERETRTKFQDAIKFLAPWFGLTVEEVTNNNKSRELILRLVDALPNVPTYFPFDKPLITLPYEPEEDRGDFTIGHELGHWFHEIINPEVYSLSARSRFYQPFNEGVANYSGIILENKSNPIQIISFFSEFVPNNFFDLSNLVRLNADEIGENKYYLRYFFRDKLAPFISVEKNKGGFLELMERF